MRKLVTIGAAALRRKRQSPITADQWELVGRAWALWRRRNSKRSHGWCVNTYGRAAFAGKAADVLRRNPALDAEALSAAMDHSVEALTSGAGRPGS
jgi:hypothetical protein